MKRKAITLLRWTVALPCVAIMLAPSAWGQGSPTLSKVEQTGMITLGYRVSSVPFSYLDEKLNPIGYSMDLCYRIVDAVKAKLKLRNLQVKLFPVTSATRIPLVVNGTVDLECGITTNTLERQKSEAFSVTTFVAVSRLLAKKSSNIQTLSDLQGEPVASTVGTTSIRNLHELNLAQKLDMKILAGLDDAESFQMVQTDRAVAYLMDDVLLRSLVASAKNPAEFSISADSLSIEPYGIALTKGDAAFKQLVDDVLVGIFRSGEIHTIYNKWFQSPVPPKGINLQLPMSAALKKAIAAPTDSGDPRHYE
ncbi:MAG: amino acid ABC transporter substrate-binding protein [Rhodoferax sp.]|nr:amino acid ABC transporter substrate-binding protein [Rhodoferax sp.]